MRVGHERLRHAVQLGVEAQVLLGGQVAVERRVLEDEPDAAAHGVALAHDVVAGDARAAAVGRQQRAEHRDRRRLAGAVGAEEAERLAGGDVEVDAAHRLDVAEALDQPAHLDGEVAHASASPSSSAPSARIR